MATETRVIGPISAYAIAVQEGYTGSKADWANAIGNAQANAQIASSAAATVQGLVESLPSDFTELVDEVDDLKSAIGVAIDETAQTFTLSDRYWISIANKNVAYASGANYDATRTGIPVNAGETYKISASTSGTGLALYAFGTDDGITETYPASAFDVSGEHSIVDHVIKIPTGVTRLFLSRYTDTGVCSCAKLHSNVDATLTQTGVAADAKAVSDAIDVVESEISEIDDVIFVQNGTMWVDAEIAEDNKGDGYYYYTNGSYSNTSGYSWIAFQIPETTTVYATSPMTSAMLCIYDNKPFGTSTFVANSGISKQETGLPTQEDPITVEGGKWVVLSHRATVDSTYVPHIYYYGDGGKSIKKPYSGKTWAVVGDSWTANNVYATKRYFDYISEELGFAVVNYGIGSTGYIAGNGENAQFYNRVTNLGTPDVVTIFGSGNDCSSSMVIGNLDDTSTDTVCGAMNYTISQYLTTYPNTPIGIIAPAPWLYNNLYPSNANNRMTQYVEAQAAVCKRWGIPFLDLYHESLLFPEVDANRTVRYYLSSSTKHINNDGQRAIYPRIREFIKGLL